MLPNRLPSLDDLASLVHNPLARRAAAESIFDKLIETRLLGFRRRRLLRQNDNDSSRGSKQSSFLDIVAQAAECFRHDALLDSPLDPKQLSAHREWIRKTALLTLEHRFDLGGEKPVAVSEKIVPPGLIGVRHDGLPKHQIARILSCASRARTTALQREIHNKKALSGYEPIPWHRDPFTGYNWDDSRRYSSQRLDHPPGADPRISWELGRLQHLPLLALAFASGAIEDKQRLVAEFVEEVKDFARSNPPGLGIHWVSGMEVGIRLANISLALCLFSASGAKFGVGELEAIFETVTDHVCFCLLNPDRRRFLTHNHYLVQLCGLVIGSAVFDESLRLGKLCFGDVLRGATTELCRQVINQFFEDGSTFEGSTGYPLFAAEAAAYGIAVAWRRASDTVGLEEATERLAKACEFVDVITDDFGRIPAIGDFDGGRFFVLERSLALPESDLSMWDRAYSLGALGALARVTGYTPRLHRVFEESVDAAVAGSMLGNCRPKPTAKWKWVCLNSDPRDESPASSTGDLILFDTRSDPNNASVFAYWPHLRLLGEGWDRAEEKSKRLWVFGSDGLGVSFGVGSFLGTALCGAADLIDAVSLTKTAPRLWRYAQSGLYVYRGSGLYAVIRCGPPGQRGWAGHSHADQLSAVLQIHGHSVLNDPGTLVYSAFPELRKAYRSARAHNGPYALGVESLVPSSSLFGAAWAAEGACLAAYPAAFCGRWTKGGTAFWRLVLIAEGSEAAKACGDLVGKRLASRVGAGGGISSSPVARSHGTWTVVILDWAIGASLGEHSPYPVSKAYAGISGF